MKNKTKTGAIYCTIDANEIVTKDIILLRLQRDVLRWAERYNRWPFFMRWYCRRRFDDVAKVLNFCAGCYYPAVAGAPSAVEELFINPVEYE